MRKSKLSMSPATSPIPADDSSEWLQNCPINVRRRIRKEARDEAIKETEAKYKRKVQETFQCVVCLLIPREGHITQCQNGHLLCEKCSNKNKGNTCPNCRAPFYRLTGNKKIRALAVEQLIESMSFPCKHLNCEFSASKKDTIMHEKKCEYRMVPCPDTCTQQLPFCGLLEHMKYGKEADRIKMNEKAGYKRRLTTTSTNHKEKDLAWDCTVLTFQNQLFAATTRKVDGIYYSFVYILGDLEEAKKFKVAISIGQGRQSMLAHTGQIFPIDAKKEDIIKEKSGVLSFSPIGMGPMGDTFFEDVEENEKVLQVNIKISKAQELNGGDLPFSISF